MTNIILDSSKFLRFFIFRFILSDVGRGQNNRIGIVKWKNNTQDRILWTMKQGQRQEDMGHIDNCLLTLTCGHWTIISDQWFMDNAMWTMPCGY